MNITLATGTLSVPAITVFHEVSRLLLTIGVGLFLGYVVLIVSANLFGLVPRYAGKWAHRKNTDPQASNSARQRPDFRDSEGGPQEPRT